MKKKEYPRSEGMKNYPRYFVNQGCWDRDLIYMRFDNSDDYGYYCTHEYRDKRFKSSAYFLQDCEEKVKDGKLREVLYSELVLMFQFYFFYFTMKNNDEVRCFVSGVEKCFNNPESLYILVNGDSCPVIITKNGKRRHCYWDYPMILKKIQCGNLKEIPYSEAVLMS